MKRQSIFSTTPRGGTTLTEVLMSLLCMAIGVVAVASLFPIALLRSVQATQLTSATILRFNAETLMELYNELPTPIDAYPANFRNLIHNPDFDDQFGEHFNKNYLIDPLGAMIVRDDNGRPLAATDKVGRMDRFDALPVFHPMPSYGTPATAIKEAEKIVTLPDSWVTLIDEFPESNNDTSVTLPTTTEINFPEMDALATDGGMRILLFSSNGKISESRALDMDSFNAPNAITWTSSVLPSNNQYFPDKVDRIRLEVKERRFTWLLTVRNNTPGSALDVLSARAQVDVVVFFRRSPTVEEETPYELTGSGRNYTVGKINGTDPDPFLKKGGFMLDTNTGEWHRLQKVNQNAISLERNSRTLNGHHAVFMKGVVDVFPLGTKP